MNAWNAADADGVQGALNNASAEYTSSTSSAAYVSSYAQQQCGGANQLSPIVHNPVPESAPSKTGAHSGTYGCYGSGANELTAAAESQYNQLLFANALQSRIANLQPNADGTQFSHNMMMAMGAPSVPGWDGSQQTSSNLLNQAVAQPIAGAHTYAALQTDNLINQYQYAATMNASLGNQQPQQVRDLLHLLELVLVSIHPRTFAQNYAVWAPAGLPQQGQGNLQQQQQQQLTNSFLNSNASDVAIGEFDAPNSSVTYAQTEQGGQTMMLGQSRLPAQGDHREDPGWEAQFRVLSKWRIEKGHVSSTSLGVHSISERR